MNCLDIGEKHYTTLCNTKITADILNDFFSDPKECSISIIYLSRRNDGESLDKVLVKQMDDTNVFFTTKNGYYFIYNIILHHMFGWSKHPRSFGIRGYLGNHIAIGINDGIFDIHETIYETKQSATGSFDVLYKKKHVFFKLNENQDINSNSIAHVYWNDIRCFASKNEKKNEKKNEIENDGGGFVNNRVLKRTQHVVKSYKINELMNIYKRRCTSKMLEENQTLFVRMPYIQPFKAHALINRINKVCNASIHCIHIFTDTFAKSSFVALNFT